MAIERSGRMVSCLSFLLGFYLISGVTALSANEQHIFIIKEAGKETSTSRLFINHVPHYVSFLQNAGSIPSNEISSINSLALGLSVPKDITWSGLLAGNMFKRPKARILFAVDGVSEGDHLNVNARTSFPVEETDEAPDLAGILSQINAMGENFPSRVSKMFGGKTLALSVSGDGKLTAAGAGAGDNSYSFFYNQEKEQFQLTVQDQLGFFEDLQLTKDQVLEKLQKISFSDGIKFSSEAKVVTVALPGQEKAVFNLNKKEDSMLFAEAQIVSDILEKLKRNPALVNDNIPDILTFSFSSLKALRDRYGEHSLQAKGAVVFLSSLISKLTKGFSDLYNGNALVEVLTTEWKGNLKDKFPEDVSHIYKHLEPHISSNSMESFQKELPSVTLRGNVDSAVLDSLCSSLHNKLLNMQSKLKVNCIGGSTSHRTRRALDESTSLKANMNSTSINLAHNYTPFYSTIFNMWLWLVVVIALTVYVVSLVLWYMDPGRDSIIYRMTSQRIKTD